MTPYDLAFLTTLKMSAFGEQLRMLREDALRLLVLAGFGPETWPYQDMAARARWCSSTRLASMQPCRGRWVNSRRRSCPRV